MSDTYGNAKDNRVVTTCSSTERHVIYLDEAVTVDGKPYCPAHAPKGARAMETAVETVVEPTTTSTPEPTPEPQPEPEERPATSSAFGKGR